MRNGQSGLDVGDDLGLAELLRLGTLAGEDDQAGLVGLETGDIGGKGLFAQVLAAGVD